MSLDSRFQRLWYSKQPDWLGVLLLPLAAIFAVLTTLRRRAYSKGWLKSWRVDKPVIVVGNITVGGTGKTPLVVWLANTLINRGYRVAIVTRGYGGAATTWPQEVDAQSNPHEVGDEAVLIAQKTAALVIVDPDRVRAARRAVERAADVLICDDGLQHYRLQRDGEIVVIDASRGLGNGQLLPAGPLREKADRLASVDLIIENQRTAASNPNDKYQADLKVPRAAFRLVSMGARSLTSGTGRSLESFRGLLVHAVAGIGNPQGFFHALRAAGLHCREHAFPDHAKLRREDIEFGDSAPVLMTEKDAVKCREFANTQHWVVEAELHLQPQDKAKLLASVDAILARKELKREDSL